MRQYTVMIERGETEPVYVATVPTLPGCVTQGATIEEALERIREAIIGHVETLAELGRPIPESDPFPLVTSVSVPEHAIAS